MTVLAVDVGNSTIKLGCQTSSVGFQRWRFDNVAQVAEGIVAASDLVAEPVFWSVCSVSLNKANQLREWVSTARVDDTFHLISADEIPIESNIDQRDQAGRDRLVAAFMARQLCPRHQPLIVVDAGTAVTIDYLDSNGVFQGGLIFPGATTCLGALTNATYQLPDLAPGTPSATEYLTPNVGRNTRDAILRGVYRSQRDAILSIVRSFGEGIAVIATGGEIERLPTAWPSSWLLEPDLVVRGALKIGQRLIGIPSET